MQTTAIKTVILCLCLGFASGTSCSGTSNLANSTAWTQRTANNTAALRPTAVETADFDGDGKLDIVAAYAGSGSSNPAVSILFQTDSDTFTAVQVASSTDLSGITALAVSDLDADTHRDVVAACNGRLVYLHSPTDPRSAAGWVLSTIDESTGSDINQWNDVAIGSIDSINGSDIVACNANTGRLCWFKSPTSPTSGTGWTRVDIDKTTRTNATGILITDVDGNGRNDIISTAPGETSARVAWYSNPTDPVASAWTKSTIGNMPGAARLALGDLNGDGRTDIAVTNPTDRQIGWYMKPTTATSDWTGYQLALYATDTPTDVKIVDVDGDSQLDVIVATQQAGTLRWFSPVGVQTLGWGENNLHDLIESVGRIALGDFDGDGRSDVAAPLQGTTTDLDSIAWFENPLP